MSKPGSSEDWASISLALATFMVATWCWKTSPPSAAPATAENDGDGDITLFSSCLPAFGDFIDCSSLLSDSLTRDSGCSKAAEALAGSVQDSSTSMVSWGDPLGVTSLPSTSELSRLWPSRELDGSELALENSETIGSMSCELVGCKYWRGLVSLEDLRPVRSRIWRTISFSLLIPIAAGRYQLWPAKGLTKFKPR